MAMSEIAALDMIRRIRDDQAVDLTGKSETEIIEFFRKATEAAREEAEKLARRPASQGV